MSDEQKLPETWEEFQRARREAFMKGREHEIRYAGTESRAEMEAKRLYPIRRKVPRVVAITPYIHATVFRDGSLRFDSPTGALARGADLSAFSVEQTEAIRDLLARPFDEVEE